MRLTFLSITLAASCLFAPLPAAAQSEPSPHVRNPKAATAGVFTALAGTLVFAGATVWWRSNQAHPSADELGGASMARPLVFLGATAIANGVPLAMFGLSERRPRHPAVYGGGIALTTIGMGLAAAGGAMLALERAPEQLCTPYETAPNAVCSTLRTDRTPALALLTAGGAGAIAGLVLWRLGDQPRAASDEVGSRALPEVSIGVGASSLRWRF